MRNESEIIDIRFVDCDEVLKKGVGKQWGEWVEPYLHLSDGFSIVALRGEAIVGIISVYRRCLPRPLPETHEGYVDIIEVNQALRRKGVARAMVQLAVERCREQGFCQLRAWSSEDKTEAIPMWKALGFGLCPATEVSGKTGEPIKGYFVTYRLQ